MALIPLRILLDHAAENDYGVAAFNVNNMEQIQSIMEAADETESPVIIQASRGARAYSQDNYLRHLMLAAAELYPHIPIVMHQDHGNSVETCQSAIDNGFTSVMMDGSLKEDGKTPADYDYNVKVTAEVVKLAHAQNVSVEGRTRLSRLVGKWRRRTRGRTRCRRSTVARSTPDRSGRSRTLRRRHRMRRIGCCDWYQPRRLQVHTQARWRDARDGSHHRDSQTSSKLPPCHARQFFRAARTARHHQCPWRSNSSDLGRARRRDSTWHQARRA